MTALHMDKLAAGSLTSSLPPLCRKDGTFDLVDTRRHNVIEHDSSFTRLYFHQGDHYTFRENTRQIMGEHSGRRYSMGDRVRVVLDRVDSVQRRLQFSILEEVAPIRLARPAKAKTRAKPAKAHPYIPPKNKVLRKGKPRAKSKRPGKKRG